MCYFNKLLLLLFFLLPASLLRAGDTIITFAIIGDFGESDTPELRVSKMVDSWNPDFIVTVGDNSYDDDSGDNLQKNVKPYYGKYIYNANNPASSDTAGKAFKNKHNYFYPCLGNHDSKNATSLKNYLSYFGFANNYYFRAGPCAFYFFDSGKCGHSSGQGKFEDSTLAEIRSWLSAPNPADEFRLVFFHHPPHTSSMGNPRITSVIDFDTLHVDAVICGHEHYYQRIENTGASQKPLYLVCGSSGAELNPDKYVDHKLLDAGFRNVLLDNHHFGAAKASIISTNGMKAIYFEYYIVLEDGSYQLEDRFFVSK